MKQKREKNGRTIRRISFLIGIMCIFVIFAGTAFAGDVFVRGYFRSNGTYVQPHYRSAPDGNIYNNWSTYPNVNPYTMKRGRRRSYNNYSGSYSGFSRPSFGRRSRKAGSLYQLYR